MTSVHPLDQRVWRAVALRLLARAGEGLALCDAELRVLDATPLAVHLLGRIGASARERLPDKLASPVNEQLASNDLSRTSRILTSSGGSVMHLHAASIAGDPAQRIMLFLREELLRDDELFARMRQELPISRRGFQLALLVRRGLSNQEIAEQLGLTESTVKVYLHHLYRDCGVSSRTALVALLARLAR